MSAPARFLDLLDTIRDYERGVPDWGVANGAAIDRRVAARAKCEECGHGGLHFRPYVKRSERRYLALAICPNCGWWTAF